MTLDLNKEDYERYLVELARKRRKIEQFMSVQKDVFTPKVHVDHDLLEEVLRLKRLEVEGSQES